MEARPAPLPGPNPVGQTPLDLASGMMLGTEGRRPRRTRRGPSLRDTLIAAAAAHMRPGRPYFVAFTGGVESTADLAIATRAARTSGCPDPIPLTLRYAALSTPEEVAAQEAVVRQLGLSDWERIEIHDQLELVGPVATRALSELGLFWPPNAFSMLPLMDRARGGSFSVMTGLSDFFGYWRWAPLAEVLGGERRPRRADARLLARALVPPALRSALLRPRTVATRMQWLRPEAHDRVRTLKCRRSEAVALSFERAVRTQTTHRCLRASQRALSALAALAGTTLVQVLFEPQSLAALARAGGRSGFTTKARLLEDALGDLLPSGGGLAPKPVDLRPVFFGAGTRAFADRWSGQGLDESLVDPERLRSIWLGPDPDSRTGGLMQAAWMHDQHVARDVGASPAMVAA